MLYPIMLVACALVIFLSMTCLLEWDRKIIDKIILRRAQKDAIKTGGGVIGPSVGADGLGGHTWTSGMENWARISEAITRLNERQERLSERLEQTSPAAADRRGRSPSMANAFITPFRVQGGATDRMLEMAVLQQNRPSDFLLANDPYLQRHFQDPPKAKTPQTVSKPEASKTLYDYLTEESE